MEVNIKRIQRDMDVINSFNSTPEKGVTRLTFSREFNGAVKYIVGELDAIGAQVSFERAGNLRGRLEGSEKGSPSVMVGSHIDSVKHGGQFDGVVGVLAALEVARVIVENNVQHRHPVDVVVFPEEEGSRFGSVLVGSRAWAGKLSLDQLGELRDSAGLSYLEAMASIGFHVDNGALLTAEGIKAMVELHIEQSVVLEDRGIQVGVVEAIAGIRQFLFTITGVSNHAGATPMRYRYDPIQGAARIICAVEEVAKRTSDRSVATVGYVNCEPGQANVIPGRVQFTIDIRDPDLARLEGMVEIMNNLTSQICEERGLAFDLLKRSETNPIALSGDVVSVIEQAATQRGIPTLRMVSGALHDSSILAEVAKVGMIFVPSKKGRSHCPEEFTDFKDIKAGAEVLLSAVVELAK